MSISLRRVLTAAGSMAAIFLATPAWADDYTDYISTDTAADKTIAACTRLIDAEAALKEHMYMLFTFRGHAYARSERLDQALKDFSTALDLQPTPNELSLENRAEVYERLGRMDEAIADYRKALDWAPRSPIPKELRQSNIDRLKAHLKRLGVAP